MSVKEQILKDVSGIDSPLFLQQILHYVQTMKEQQAHVQSNKEKVLAYAGLLNNIEAKKITDIINSNFNTIEGEW